MATSPTGKSVQEEDDVQREEVDPAKTTEEEAIGGFLGSDPNTSALNQNPQEGSITIRRSGETMEHGSTSFASDQNPFRSCPYLGGIQYDGEQNCGLLGFSNYRSGPMMDGGSTSFATDQNRGLDSYPNTSAHSLSIQNQATENQNRLAELITNYRSGQTMEPGSTSSASEQNRGFLPPQQMIPHLGPSVPSYQQERSAAPVQMSQAMMPSDVNPVTQPQYQMMNQPETWSASEHNPCLFPPGPQMFQQRMRPPHLRPSVPPYQQEQQMMMPPPYQQEQPATPFQVSQQMTMPPPYQQERPATPYQLLQEMLMPHLTPVGSVQNEFNQPFGKQRGKRNFEVGEGSSSSRKRQNVGDPSQQGSLDGPGGLRDQLSHLDSHYRRGQAPGMPTMYNQQHGVRSSQNNLRLPFGMRQQPQPLWQIQAPGVLVPEGYQAYLERLGRLSGRSDQLNPFNQWRQNQPPWMNYNNQPQQQAVMNYNNQPQQQAVRPMRNYNNQPQLQPVMNYNNQRQQQLARPMMNYNNRPQQQPVMNYNNQLQQQPARPMMNFNNQQQQFNQGQQRFRFPMNVTPHHQASPNAAAAVPPRPEQNQQLQAQTQQPRQFQGSNTDDPSSSGQGQG